MVATIPIPSLPALLPGPRAAGVRIRLAVASDVPFLSLIQKQHRDAVEPMPRRQFWECVMDRQVLVAEGETAYSPLGYVIVQDRHLKRDELGIVHQLCVVQTARRKLIGASLLQAAFSRLRPDCRLVCCWSAQDLGANHFWESMGFTPLAFRTSEDKGCGRRGRRDLESDARRRVYLFWQRRLIAGDESTPWWYPAQSMTGIIKPERIVFPIPPGVHWKDVQPVVLPGNEKSVELSKPTVIEQRGMLRKGVVAGPPPGTVGILVGGRIKYVPRRQPMRGLWFAPPAQAVPEPPVTPVVPKRVPPNVHVKHLERARELRDRWLADVNNKGWVFEELAKYEIARIIPGFSAGVCPSSATSSRRSYCPRMIA